MQQKNEEGSKQTAEQSLNDSRGQDGGKLE